ncbi:MAG: DNA-J related domain-containing protein [Motiliproteus sp.]
MKHNPLAVPICRILRVNPQGLSEYALLNQLRFDGLEIESKEENKPGNAELLLFRKHFLIMNALYQLQPVFYEEGLYLHVSALLIKLEPIKHVLNELELIELDTVEDSTHKHLNSDYPQPTFPCLAGEQAIREYYLDWSEFELSSSESVQQLLDSFWQRYYADDQQQQALDHLQLTADCRWPEIRHAYRKLAAIHHPDKGGDSDRFRQIREAYELLACCRR